MRRPDTAAFRLSPPLGARSLTRLAIRSGKSHPGLSTHPQPDWQQLKSHSLRAIRPSNRCGRVRTVHNSPSDMIVCQRAVRRNTCSRVTRRSTRATEARGASGIHVGQPAPKIALKASHKAFPRPGACLGRTSARLMQPEVWRLRHELSWLEGVCSHRSVFVIFGEAFPSQDGPPERKFHLGSG